MMNGGACSLLLSNAPHLFKQPPPHTMRSWRCCCGVGGVIWNIGTHPFVFGAECTTVNGYM